MAPFGFDGVLNNHHPLKPYRLLPMFLSPLRFAARYRTTTLEGTDAEVETTLRLSTDELLQIDARAKQDQESIGSIFLAKRDHGDWEIVNIRNSGKISDSTLKPDSVHYKNIGTILLREACKLIPTGNNFTTKSFVECEDFYKTLGFKPQENQPTFFSCLIKALTETLDQRLASQCLDE